MFLGAGLGAGMVLLVGVSSTRLFREVWIIVYERGVAVGGSRREGVNLAVQFLNERFAV